MDNLIADIDHALHLLAEREIFDDLGSTRANNFMNDLNELKECLLSGNPDVFDANKIGYFRGPTPYDDVYKDKTHNLFRVTLKILNELSQFRINNKI